MYGGLHAHSSTSRGDHTASRRSAKLLYCRTFGALSSGHSRLNALKRKRFTDTPRWQPGLPLKRVHIEHPVRNHRARDHELKHRAQAHLMLASYITSSYTYGAKDFKYLRRSPESNTTRVSFDESAALFSSSRSHSCCCNPYR